MHSDYNFTLGKYKHLPSGVFTQIFRFILILTFGIILISLGNHLKTLYVSPGDTWVGISPAIYIDHSNLSPLNDLNYGYGYPLFWGYISYGLSTLSGLPFINIIVSSQIINIIMYFNYKSYF